MVQDFGRIGGVSGMVVPYVTESSPRGERTMDIYSHPLKDRIIFLGTPVDDQAAKASELPKLISQSISGRGWVGTRTCSHRGTSCCSPCTC
jgi:hypothetical protein